LVKCDGELTDLDYTVKLYGARKHYNAFVISISGKFYATNDDYTLMFIIVVDKKNHDHIANGAITHHSGMGLLGSSLPLLLFI
jgi:hypothetical protein